MSFSYKCRTCDETHEGIPHFVFDYPNHYLSIPESEREARSKIDSDTCVIDGQSFYIRVNLEIPVLGYEEPFVWGLWVSVHERNYNLFRRTYESVGRENEAPFFAWLTDVPYPYPEDMPKTMVHLRAYPTRPWLEVEPTAHPLSVDYHKGLSPQRMQEIAELLLHGG